MPSMQFTVSVHDIYTIHLYIASIRYEPYGSVFDSFTKFCRYMQYTDTVNRLHRYIIIPYTVCRYGLRILYTVYGVLYDIPYIPYTVCWYGLHILYTVYGIYTVHTVYTPVCRPCSSQYPYTVYRP